MGHGSPVGELEVGAVVEELCCSGPLQEIQGLFRRQKSHVVEAQPIGHRRSPRTLRDIGTDRVSGADELIAQSIAPTARGVREGGADFVRKQVGCFPGFESAGRVHTSF